MSEIRFSCGNCGSKIEADVTLAGKVMQCPKCHNALKVPEELMKPGMSLGGYTLEELLGQGGMGEVWLATQSSIGRKVALKILSPSLSRDKEFINRFNNEMKLIGRLDHPGIVSAYAAGNSNGFYFLSTYFVDGKTVASELESGKVFEEKEALIIARKVAEALKYAWEKHRILHRDVKPANIMVDKGGEVKLMDMGISKCLNEDTSITMTGIIVGTPYYMSPEQAKAEKDIDFRADIYSLGATLYYMLTGRLPYDATSAMAILARVISEQATEIRKINSNVSPGCEKLISKMMAKNKDQRYASWQEVIDEIDEIIDDNGTPVAAFTEPQEEYLGRSDWLLKAGVILIAVCFVVFSIALIRRAEHRKIDTTDEIMPGSNVDDIAKDDSSSSTGDRREEKIAKKAEIHVLPKAVVRETSQPVPATAAKPDERQRTCPTTTDAQKKSPEALKKPVPGAVETPARRFEFGKNLFLDTLETSKQKAGLTDNETEKLRPIIKNYFQRLKQVHDEKPSGGYTYAEWTGKCQAVYADTRKEVEAQLPKDKAEKLLQILEEGRKQFLRNIMHASTAPPPATTHK